MPEENKKIQLVWIDDRQDVFDFARVVFEKNGLNKEVELIPILASKMRENLENLSSLSQETIVFIDGLDGTFGHILNIVRKNNPERRVCIVSNSDYEYEAGELGAEFYDKLKLCFTEGMMRKVVLNEGVK